MTPSMSGREFETQLQADIQELRAELDAAVLQIHSEIADDRKRITMIEEFARELYSLLWVKYRSWRMELEAKLRNHLPYFYSTERTENNVEGVTAEHTHTYPYV